MKRLARRAWSLLRLTVSWYLAPAGILYLAVLGAGVAVALVQGSVVGVVAAAVVLLGGLIPYKLARERHDWLAADRSSRAEVAADAKKARRKVRKRIQRSTTKRIVGERNEILGSIETVRKEARDVIWSERLYWRAALDGLEEAVSEVRGVLAKLESRDDALQSRLGDLEEAIKSTREGLPAPDDLREVRGDR